MKPNALTYHNFYYEGDYTLQFLYCHDKQCRKTSFSENGVPVLEKYFVGLYEKEKEGIEIDAVVAFRYAGFTTDLLMSVAGITIENPLNYYKWDSMRNMSSFKLLFYNLAVE